MGQDTRDWTDDGLKGRNLWAAAGPQPGATLPTPNQILRDHQRELEAAQAKAREAGDTSAWPYAQSFPDASQLPAPPQADDDGSADDLLDAARLSDLIDRLNYATSGPSNPGTIRGVIAGMTRVVESLQTRARTKVSSANTWRSVVASMPRNETVQTAWQRGDTTYQGHAPAPGEHPNLEGESSHKACKWIAVDGWHTVTITGEGANATDAMVRAGIALLKLDEMMVAVGHMSARTITDVEDEDALQDELAAEAKDQPSTDNDNDAPDLGRGNDDTPAPRWTTSKP